ncbi:Ion transport protein [Alloiococcus otitis]|uniref:Ion transport domain-containing protein n=1 Tax=Alloiococcus otitis ATCC 51267 TaxID=883081 RepID=K9EQA1_9LACT|nr:ion transporter [Alloiococcus otitis]EKU93112.1 hypothetical protein HMPREF9698_01189 [Alloiococcus otitis ATCC 51267]SUU80746.1 Ion transport protein [Alloiococcus otitis]
MREKIFQIISVQDSDSLASKAYNTVNIFLILISLLPLMFKSQDPLLQFIDNLVLVFFIVEYFLHFITADIKYDDLPKHQAFLRYPVSFFGIVDLLSILPMMEFVSSSFRLLRLFRLVQSARVFRVFKIFRYSNSIDILIKAIIRQKDSLQLVLWTAVLYLLITSLLIFNIEPESFPSFMDALFWSAGALTSATFGDYFPSSPQGQLIGILSFMVGVLIIALPSSIITAGYVDELKAHSNIEDQNGQEQEDEQAQEKSPDR